MQDLDKKFLFQYHDKMKNKTLSIIVELGDKYPRGVQKTNYQIPKSDTQKINAYLCKMTNCIQPSIRRLSHIIFTQIVSK